MRRWLIAFILAPDRPRHSRRHRTPRRGLAVATFAGGCFWCMEEPFDKLPGVIATISGYTGGTTPNPTYEQVSAGHRPLPRRCR